MAAVSKVWSHGLITMTDTNVSGHCSWKAINSTSFPGYWKCALLDTCASHLTGEFFDASGQVEVTNDSGTAYTALGYALTTSTPSSEMSVAHSTTTAGRYVEFGCTTNPTWGPNATFGATYVQVMAATASASTCRPLAQFYLTSEKQVTDGTFTLTFGTHDTNMTEIVFNMDVTAES